MDADQYAEIIADELNVKELKIPIGTDDRGRAIEVKYVHDTLGGDNVPLDMYIDGMAQNKRELAQSLFMKWVDDGAERMKK